MPNFTNQNNIIMKKYGNKWTRVESDPTTDNSWLAATIENDQLWIDEVEGYMFLREGKFNPIWYKSII